MTRITLETEKLVIIHKGMTVPIWCPECGAKVDAIILGDPSQIQPGSCSDGLHVFHEPDGTARICLPSLLHSFNLEGIPKSQMTKERS
jgi:hypothetical protein